jgi:hypothetical protein
MDLPALTMLTALAVVVLGLAVTVVANAATRRRMRADVRSCRAEIADLRAQVDELSRTSGFPEGELRDDYVITALLLVAPPPASVPGDAREAAGFVSLAVGESLVRAVSLAHGVRRALSPENRQRIRFEMRREVKRARKQRRRDVRQTQRHLRTRPAGQRRDVDEEAA